MIKRDWEMRLTAGMPIPIENGFYRTPKVKDIVEMGEEKYNQYLSALLFDKSNIDGEFENIDNFELLCGYYVHDVNFRNIFFNALKFVFKEEGNLNSDSESVFFDFYDWRIDKNNFPMIQELVRVSNHINIEKEDYNPGNEKAAKFIERIKAIKASRPKKKETMNLNSIINGLAWRENGINIFNVYDLTIYQLYQGFFSTEKFDNYRFTLTGIYSGSVDGKKINYTKLHWASIDN